VGDTEPTDPLAKFLSGRCLGSENAPCEYSNNIHIPSLPSSIVQKFFKRLPTTLEWARFRKYARRMRNLAENYDLITLSPDVFPALRVGTVGEPLLPNLRTLSLWSIIGELIPFIPFFLSPRITAINIEFSGFDLPTPMVVSTLTILPTLCPNLEKIILQSLRRDPATAAAVSRMLLATNQNTLRHLQVNSLLTDEAREVICKLPNLRELSVEISSDASLPLAMLPNLTRLRITHDCDCDSLFRMFYGAKLERLESVAFHSRFYSRSEQTGDFLGAFERVALAASAQNTLSKFTIRTAWSWNPIYSSLLPFTQMTYLEIRFSCIDGCSSSVDDNIITDLARAMPKLENLLLGGGPCRFIQTGVTINGLVVLAHRCPNLSALRIHFQVASLTAPPAAASISPNAGSTPRRDCALTELEVGVAFVPEGSSLVVALTLVRIFPRIESIYAENEDWEMVLEAISLSRRIVDCSSKQPHLSLHLELTSMAPHQEPHSRVIVNREIVNRETVRRDSALTLHQPLYVSVAQQNLYLHTASTYGTECSESRAIGQRLNDTLGAVGGCCIRVLHVTRALLLLTLVLLPPGPAISLGSSTHIRSIHSNYYMYT